MKKLSELKDMWGKDCVIDRIELDTESLRVSTLHQKYLDLYTDFNAVMKKLKIKQRSLYKLKWEFYLGKLSQEELDMLDWEYDGKKVLRSDISVYLDADKDMNDIQDAVDNIDTKLNYLKEVLKSIQTRGFQIKSAVDWAKFVSGGN
jgi:hypothetical protein